MSACESHVRRVRDLAAKTLAEAGISTSMAENVQLVASELIGNAVRLLGDLVPLVVEVDAAPIGVWVKVHDPDAETMPRRAGVSMDDPEATSGRGLLIIDFLAPGWHIAKTPIGKQIRAHLPYEGDDRD